MKKSVIFALCLVIFFTFSCSLKYEQDEEYSEDAPEFTFTGLQMNRLEDGRLSAVLEAAKLEQYRNEDAMYAKNVVFTLYDENNKITVTGSCGLIVADMVKKEYSLFSDVDVMSHDQNISVKGQNVHWSEKTEQLICGKDDLVIIGNGGGNYGDEYASAKKQSSIRIQIEGKGFSASGVSMSYKFDDEVSGTILTDIVDSVTENELNLTEEQLAKEAEKDQILIEGKQDVK
ncbi:MAG: LPS export ABC transporter periplasmic protein LptC [Treponema sp.]|nr:LPS export ABC transporter periplasmic protein LptC [Treponema sp.]